MSRCVAKNGRNVPSTLKQTVFAGGLFFRISADQSKQSFSASCETVVDVIFKRGACRKVDPPVYVYCTYPASTANSHTYFENKQQTDKTSDTFEKAPPTLETQKNNPCLSQT